MSNFYYEIVSAPAESYQTRSPWLVSFMTVSIHSSITKIHVHNLQSSKLHINWLFMFCAMKNKTIFPHNVILSVKQHKNTPTI